MRKFLCVVDETPECRNALRFAARRAQKTGGMLQMLFVIRPEEFQHWIGVAERMRAEAREEAEARFQELAGEIRDLTGLMPEFVIREGEPDEQILAQMKEDPDVGVLVLGAAADGEGPGPLVTGLVSGRGGRLPAPVTVVPGAMSPAEIDAVY
jgi:nucleotide-binding universal stress UspA family protein